MTITEQTTSLDRAFDAIRSAELLELRDLNNRLAADLATLTEEVPAIVARAREYQQTLARLTARARDEVLSWAKEAGDVYDKDLDQAVHTIVRTVAASDNVWTALARVSDEIHPDTVFDALNERSIEDVED